MISEIRLNNYKSYEDSLIGFNPITILCGGNSSGKTSIIKSILLFKQSFESNSNNTLLLNGSYTNNGFYNDILHNSAKKASDNAITFSFNIELTEDDASTALKDIKKCLQLNKARRSISNISINVTYTLSEDKNNPQIALVDKVTVNTMLHFYDGMNMPPVESEITLIKSSTATDVGINRYDFRFLHLPARKNNKLELLNFPAVSDKTGLCHCYFSGLRLVSIFIDSIPRDLIVRLSYIYTIFRIISNEFDKIKYLGPLRKEPLRYYLVQDIYSDVGTNGENTAQYLSQHQADEILYYNPFKNKLQKACCLDALNIWLDYLNIGRINLEGVTIPGQSIVQLFINAQNITDVGFGIGQILPILVYGLTLQKGETLVLEQPEIHLHPSLQMLLADFIIAIKKSGKRVILETHSDHIINRIVRRAVELSIDIDDILMLYIEKKNNLSQTKRISIDLNVGIGDAPKGFFDQYASETDSIIQAGYQNYMKRENENV